MTTTTDGVSPAEERQFLMEWATRQHARFEPEGTCGFGRECVGILASNGCYPDYEGWADYEYSIEAPWVTPAAEPPAGVDDAYHKHPCLAVLGRGDAAVHQLYLWVKHLDANGIVIEVHPKPVRDVMEMLLTGGSQAILTKPAEVSR